MAENHSTILWDIPPEKRCAKCKKRKFLTEFGRVKGRVRSYCRECHKSSNYNPDLRTEKSCSYCKETKVVSEFNRSGKRFQPFCRKCQNERDAIRRTEEKSSGKNIEINRNDYCKRRKWIKLKSQYGISKEQYEEMVRGQNNCCAICGNPESEMDGQRGTPLNLSVDHDHCSGKVRGLLCRQCNIGIGRLKESTEILQKAIDYLSRYS